MGAVEKFGNKDMAVRFLLIELIVKPSLLANVETWCNISKEEEMMITQALYEVLEITFKQRDKVPYHGIIVETGIWPYKDEIMY